jgi:cytochrome P450
MSAEPAQMPPRGGSALRIAAQWAAPSGAQSSAQVYDEWVRANPHALPVHGERWDVSRSDIYAQDCWQGIFAEMRREAPVNHVASSPYGPFWNVASAQAIRHVEANPQLFSSSFEQGGIALGEPPHSGVEDFDLPMFIAMDGAEHAKRRRTVAPAFSPAKVADMALAIRQHTGAVLDRLPLATRFDWVENVSIELTSGALARVLGVPWADRRLLAWWSDWASDIELTLADELFARRRAMIREMAGYFGQIWLGRVGSPPSDDLISMMMHSDSLSKMSPEEFMGNLTLLVVGGSDTTRNSMSGIIEALERFPDQRALFETDAAVIPNAVHEAIRFVTPFAHMRRTALQDCELFGQQVRAGDKLALWYISANHDEAVFADPDRLDLTRANARHHLSFGHGVHRCIGARLAELQLRILLEEMHERRLRPRVCGRVERVRGNFAHGFRRLEVELERF